MDNLCDDVAFFATGNEYMRDALNFNFIPHDVGGGILPTPIEICNIIIW